MILAVLKIHHGANLEAVLTQEVTPEDEDTWRRLCQEEENEDRRLAESRGRSYSLPANNLRGSVVSLSLSFCLLVSKTDDLIFVIRLSFRSLKKKALGNVIGLRDAGLVTRDDKYQALLDAIAVDIRQKR